MIGLDTNILLRILVRDDPEQFASASRFIDDAVRKGETLFINRIVLAELVWVLNRRYDRSRTVIADTLERLLMTAEFEVEDSTITWQALREYRRTAADFADCLIGAVNHDSGCSSTATFDRKTENLEAFTLLEK